MVLIGYGPQEKSLRQLVVDLGIAAHVRFVIGEDARCYYQLFDCFVQPSDKEGMSLALLEAMHASRACVVMGVDYAHPVIDHGINGMVTSVADEPALADVINYLRKHSTVVQRLGQRSKHAVEKYYTHKAMITKYDKLFEGAIHRNAK